MRLCLSSPLLAWSEASGCPSQCGNLPRAGCDSGLTGVLALSLTRGDIEVCRAACLGVLGHLARVAHSLVTLHPREGRLTEASWSSDLFTLQESAQSPARRTAFLRAHLLLVKSCSGQLEPLSKCICVGSILKSE